MYLLDTSTLLLHSFEGNQRPAYAILSHRWGDEEVTFREIKDGKGNELAGFAKLVGCCKQAASDGWQYVWIDSCCIDKSSSAELSEAINSMFRWYRDAEVCYAYLVDVPEAGGDPCLPGSYFRRSKWFTRGWTLQELLAPSTVIFYDCGWSEIGTKSSLYNTIVSITGIQHLANFEEACVAQKMSWASRRETTRIEDMAYCLMGLFGVNMPPLYGEGENAFRRLQLEILNTMDDESLFAWKEERGGVWPWMLERSGLGGLLAHSPTAFKDSGDVRRIYSEQERPPFSNTNKGIRIELQLLRLKDVSFPKGAGPHPKEIVDAFLAPLNFRLGNSSNCLAIYLKKIGENIYQRGIRDLIPWQWNGYRTITQVVHVRQDEDKKISFELLNQKEFTFSINCRSLLESGFTVSQRYVREHMSFSGHEIWEAVSGGFKMTLRFSIFNTLAALMFENGNKAKFVILIEIGNLEQVGVKVLTETNNRSLEEIVILAIEGDQRKLYIDRVTEEITKGLHIMVCLKKRMEKGSKIFALDVLLRDS